MVPIDEIVLEKLTIKPSGPVTVNDDWQREHFSGSITVDEEGYNGLIDNWIILHALMADSRLPLYVLHAKGEEPSSFQIEDFDNTGNERIVPRVIQFDPSDVLPAVYLGYENVPTTSYKEVYEKYPAKDDVFVSAIKNYFVAQDVNHHKRLRYIDTSYWQIVMLISSL